jgi:hypothetical protein
MGGRGHPLARRLTMPVYVFYGGRLIEKKYRPANSGHAASDLPAPAVQSFESYESPVDTGTISSHRQRDKDLHNSGSYDPRDTPAEFRKARDGRRKLNKRLAAKSPRYS